MTRVSQIHHRSASLCLLERGSTAARAVLWPPPCGTPIRAQGQADRNHLSGGPSCQPALTASAALYRTDSPTAVIGRIRHDRPPCARVAANSSTRRAAGRSCTCASRSIRPSAGASCIAMTIDARIEVGWAIGEVSSTRWKASGYCSSTRLRDAAIASSGWPRWGRGP